ncbi:MAG: RidA family protein [Kordiimonadaceae bacterium]|jgi:hypothetical protein|nr:RidA family protein [Kordiimonadaceae bacterium]MBT6036900.1 RidA family protein [Kordiimonadaceae bacterium]MBT6328504.1 RidA family protein [Kordiimonadaceae bacterium]MBT7581698.1 RidA family protein [Kordiimonadaceae bacterium]
MKTVIKITLLLLVCVLSFQTNVMAQEYWDKSTIDAAFKKELIALGFEDGKYLDRDEYTSAHQPYIVSGNIIHTASISAFGPDGTALQGKIPTDVSQEELYVASRLACVGAIHHIRNAAGGDLSKVRKIANIRYLTLSEPEYIDYALVSNECSTLMVRVFGQTVGSHTRFAVGVVASPNNESFKINVIAYLK